MRPALLALLAAAPLVLLACSGPEVACRVGADCASGVCNGDGTCGALPGADGGADASVEGDAGLDAGADAGLPGDDGGTLDAGVDGGTAPTCQPNQDGVIERSEVFLGPGLRATFRVSGPATWDTAGTALPDGGTAWDLSGALAQDQSVLVETQPIAGQWFESDYPDAGYVVPMGQGSDLLGVFSAQADGLYLLGVASPTDGAFKTRLSYSPPVKLLAFPLALGATFSTSASVSGWYNGALVTWVQTDDYTSTVDRAGELTTPYARFPVLRVRTVLARSVNFVPTLTSRTFQWVTECFGSVATVTSTDNETSTEFTQLKEARRLSP